MSERYQGGYITATVVNPDGPIADSATATGVWTLVEQFTFHKAGLWPNGNSRGVLLGGSAEPAIYNVIDFIQINNSGDATDFGDLTVALRRNGANSSLTRAISHGGQADPNAVNSMEFVTIASAGNATDFGDQQAVGHRGCGGVASKTRSVFHEGSASTPAINYLNVISYVTTATTGNATDFGDLSLARNGTSGCCSPVRGIFWMGAKTPDGSSSNVIDYVTIASTGNAADLATILKIVQARVAQQVVI